METGPDRAGRTLFLPWSLPVGVRSPYDVLRVEPDADDEAVRRAYRERVKETHPDLGGSDEALRQVVAAYEAITDGEAGVERADRREPPGEWVRPEPTTVEYLNYELLEERGWSIDDDGLFERAADADLDAADHGQFQVEPSESLLEAAERCGHAWPFACRGGACANCAVAVTAGELSLPVDHVLSDDLVDQGIRLSCNGRPTTQDLEVVYNVKHRPDLDELRLPPYPFDRAQRTA